MSFNVTNSRQESPLNHGPVVKVMTWWFVIVSLLAVAARFGTKMAILRKLTMDDGMIVISFVSDNILVFDERRSGVLMLGQILSIGQTIATNFEVSNGLGRHVDTLSASHISDFQKVRFL